MVNRELAESVVALANARDEYEDAKAELAALQAAWQAEHASLIERVAAAHNRVLDIEATIRAYPASAEERKPAHGLSVRMTTQLSYDQVVARDWAIDGGLWTLLLLDKAAFEKAALGLKPDFVEIKSVPTITIARDLTKAREQILNDLLIEATLEKYSHRGAVGIAQVTNWDEKAEAAARTNEQSS